MCLCRKKVYKAPKVQDTLFAAPQPGSLGSLSFPEFGYVLRARQAAERAQQQDLRAQMGDTWASRGADAEAQHDEQQYDEGADGTHALCSFEPSCAPSAIRADSWSERRSLCPRNRASVGRACMLWCTAAMQEASHATVLLACAGMQDDLHYDAGAGFDDDGGYDDGGYPGELSFGELSFDDLADAAASGQPAHAGMHVNNPQVDHADHT